MTDLARSAYAHLARQILARSTGPPWFRRREAGQQATARRRQSTSIPTCAVPPRRATSVNSVGDCAQFARTPHKVKSSGPPPVIGGNGWLAPLPTGLPAEERAILALSWRQEACDHHASIASCARFVLQLLGVGAPVKLVAAAQRAGDDEITHTELCLAMASAYAGRSITLGAHHGDVALESTSDPTAIAVQTVRTGCVGETIRAAVATAAAQQATDPAVRRVFVRIAADETRHAGLAWRYLKWTLHQQLDPALLEATAAMFDAQLAHKSNRLAGAARRTAQEPSQPSILGSAERSTIALRTMRLVVMPCAHALLDEARAPKSPVPAADVA
ncbi:MAG: ferritin-like domain-containing protein [Deltaproteobacteria bacterium]|nr:ferritin-like domain-containing protein [Deltaproteobacteria bacterium]